MARAAEVRRLDYTCGFGRPIVCIIATLEGLTVAETA